MLTDKIISKAPKKLPKDKQGYLDNLETLSIVSLTEVLDRQKKLLNDRVFIKKLPDKGARILKFKECLEKELKKRNELLDVCEVMSGLTVNGKELSDNLEWSNRNKENPSTSINDEHQSSDNEEGENPLKIIATHSGAGFHKKKLIKEKEPEPLIQPSDLIIDKDGEEDNLQSEPYVEALCSKFDADKSKERFLPYKTLVNIKDLTNAKIRDNTAASPPVSKLSNAKQISLHESLRLQAQQAQHLREVQMKHAAERLQEKGSVSFSDILPPPETTAHYRESPPSDSEEEILDEDAKEERGGVTFPLANS